MLQRLFQSISRRMEAISIKLLEVDFRRILSAILVKSMFQSEKIEKESIKGFIQSYTNKSYDFTIISLFLDELIKRKIIDQNFNATKIGYKILSHLVTCSQ